MTPDLICPGCGHAGMRVFHEARDVPTNSCILLETEQEARDYPRGDIVLAHCPQCAFIGNTAFDAQKTEYSGRYEETQGFSATFRKFHRGLADRLTEQLGLQGRTILEIGCGKGEFLLMLCEDGQNRGIGFDPAYRPDRHAPAPDQNVRFVQDFYSERYSDVDADVVCCKMTLEHIQPTAEFMATVRRAIGDRAADVFFMIPETARILEDCAFEDVYYEHVSYFTRASLAELFSRTGFTVQDLGNEYDGQYLTILATTNGTAPATAPVVDPSPARVAELVDGFPALFERKVGFWRDRLAEVRAAGRKAVIWGSGSKGVSFLTTLGLGTGDIVGAVDINPHRHGYFMPGTGHRILAPDELPDIAPDVIVVMNGIYREEIAADARKLGVDAEILTLDDA
jgi:2-polyprenyl-3-methyl-5-hydroxy-6-metoxy-1,4-benzoquinol methylase